MVACLSTLLLAGCFGAVEGSASGAGLPEDGVYLADVTLEGGSGKSTVESPAMVTIKDGNAYAAVVWSSSNYDYMIVDGEKILNESTEGNSTFTIPVAAFGEKFSVIGDTTAMSTPHEVEYTLCFELRAAGEQKSADRPDTQRGAKTENQGVQSGTEAKIADAQNEAKIDGLGAQTGTINLNYASQYQIDEYGDYHLITIADSERFLLVPEGAAVPNGLSSDIVILQQPLDRTYLVSTSAMDLIQIIGALPNIRLSGTQENQWYVEEAAAAMKDKSLIYAGKYNAPDYERILSEGCNLAIENTMISHNPEVKEKLNALGIPVLIERSSYEPHPLGRLEWVRLYGVLFDRQAEADAWYAKQLQKIQPILDGERKNITAAFFSISTNGTVTVRRTGDYIARMIELAGGTYVPDNIKGEDNALSTVKLQMEDFYAGVKDADVLIYNSTIEGELTSLDSLVAKNPLLADFKAVKGGRVYCTRQDFFQKSTGIGQFMEDLDMVFTSSEGEPLRFLYKLK